MPVDRVCPFCGLAANVPHESQAQCIQALHAEIERMREVLNYVKDPLRRAEPDEDVEVT